MKYSVTFKEEDYEYLITHLFTSNNEQAAYALCRSSISESEVRLIVREIILVKKSEITESSERHMVIPSISFLRAMKKADQTNQCFLFIHSHPPDVIKHSEKDDEEEKKLFKTAYNRISAKGVHGSIVISNPQTPIGRVWLEDGSFTPISIIRTIGRRFKFYTNLGFSSSSIQFFDRQIRAFGEDIQKLLNILTIGIIGLGGTGSAVAEQLIRLGVGKIKVSDGQVFEKTNVNRVYGSRTSDDKQEKIKIIERSANDINLGTKIISFNRDITYEDVIKSFRDCDIIFGCTDDQWGRSILNRFAIYYIIPVFDMGVKIDSQSSHIKSIEGRVTTLLPNEACLFCRERINPKAVQSESINATNPEAAENLRREGYIPELDEPAPAVIPFTTMIASWAISEFIHRLTGFMGEDRDSSEVIFKFHEPRIRTNRPPSKHLCICNDQIYIGRADTSPFLDLTWR